MNKLVVTYIPNTSQYIDRCNQIIDAIPKGFKGRILTKKASDSLEHSENLDVMEFSKSIFTRSVFLNIYLFFYIKRLKCSEIIVLDWFRNFTLLCLLKFILRKKIRIIYAPLISDFGWLYKRVNKLAPSCGLRYDWLRIKGSLIDYIYCKSVDGVVVQSERLADFYCRIYKISKDNVFVNYNHFEFTLVQKPHSNISNSKKISIGFVGNIERHKGLSDMIKICSALPQEFQLILAGKTKGYENKKLFRSLMATGKCIWMGQIQRDKILKLYEEIDCLLLLSFHEGSPRVIREFLEYNKAIFLYNNPGLDYMSGLQACYFYDYGDWKRCLNAIKTHNFNDTIKRKVPKRLTYNNLKLILKEMQ
tara:strand:- start:20176 stop:21261 length:1086 start_codon:yes stop_codon:yes gene_type:complete